jgi:hypothetical protein
MRGVSSPLGDSRVRARRRSSGAMTWTMCSVCMPKATGCPVLLHPLDPRRRPRPHPCQAPRSSEPVTRSVVVRLVLLQGGGPCACRCGDVPH